MTNPINPTDEHADLTPAELDAAELELANRHLEPGGFVGLFRTLARSGIWDAGTPARKQVWLTLLLLADTEGLVALSPAELAREADLEQPAADDALAWLVGSGRIAREGERVRIANHSRYRELIHPRQTAAHTEDTTNGSTQKGTRETGGSE
jgi:hypothetical protein